VIPHRDRAGPSRHAFSLVLNGEVSSRDAFSSESTKEGETDREVKVLLGRFAINIGRNKERARALP